MKRQLIALCAAGIFGITGTGQAAPHGGGGGHGGGGHGGGVGHVGGGAVHSAGVYHGGTSAYHNAGVYHGATGAYHNGAYNHSGYGGYGGYGGYRGGYGGYGGYGGFGGFGLGYWFSPLGYGYIPWTNRGGYYGTYGGSNYAIPTNYGAPVDGGFQGLPNQQLAPTGEYGLQITQLFDGPAKTGQLRSGDIILGIGQTRTQTFAELQQALAANSGKQAEVVFVNSESKKIEKLPVTAVDGKIGVEVLPVDVR